MLAVDVIDHELDQLGATGYVGVERHGSDPEAARHLSHGEGG